MTDQQMEIVLNDWTGGMWNDEYTGSFFYWENIDIRSNSKAFKLWAKVDAHQINVFSTGEYNKLVSVFGEVLWFSNNWNIDWYNTYWNWAAYWTASWWWLWKVTSPRSYKNALFTGKYLVWITWTAVDVFDVTNQYWLWILGSEVLLNPWLTSNTSWTVWAWRTTWTWWATHTPWSSEVLSQTITETTERIRVMIYITWATTWTVAINWDIFLFVNDKRVTTFIDSWVTNIYLSPSLDFDWTVKYASVRAYDSDNIDIWWVTITASNNHPAIYDSWNIYIWSWMLIELIDTTLTFQSWVKETALTLQVWDDIIWITKIWDLFNIYVNNWVNWIKYMWDWIDEFPAEKITWKNKQFLSVDNDWENDYVICWNENDKELYISNGYQKQLMYISWYMTNPSWNYESLTLEQRLNFSSVVGFYKDTVLLWWFKSLYSVWTHIPWLPTSCVKDAADDWDYNFSTILSSAVNWVPYISYKTVWLDTNINMIAKLLQDKYTDRWYLVTNPMLFDNLSTEKLIKKFRIWYLLPSDSCSINIYARVNDKYYYTFYVSWITTEPTIWDIYRITTNHTFEVIKKDITDWSWTISCKAELPTTSDISLASTLTKVSWWWQNSINYSDFDNLILVKTITTDKYKYWYEEIFGSSFIDIWMPNVYKLQLKIELISTNDNYSPEVFDIQTLSDIG